MLYDDHLLTSQRITNIKISAEIDTTSFEWGDRLKNCNIKSYGNFFVWKSKPFVYIIFPQANHINITGLREKSLIEKAFNTFREHFNIVPLLKLKQIDNFTVCGRIKTFSNLFCLSQYLSKREGELESVKFNSSVFPATYFKLKSKGTFVILNSGSFNLVGLKCINEVEKQLTYFRAIIQNFECCLAHDSKNV